MNQSPYRFDPKQILDAEWRGRAWRGWLRSRWLGREDAAPTPPDGGTSPTIAPPPLVPPPAGVAETAPAREIEVRRAELRGRIDGVLDRLARVEDGLESLVKRFALHSIHARRHEQRQLERFDGNGEMLERQTLAVEAMQAALERIEQRIERLERRSRDEECRGESVALTTRESVTARSTTRRQEYEDYADLEEAFTGEGATGARLPHPFSVEGSEACPTSGPSIHGNLSEMSLGTVLAMLELERRTGLLQVSSEDGRAITAALRAGDIVGARRREVDADPVEAVREALRYRSGHFWFRQSAVEFGSGPARSVGSILLEATSRNDEAARVG